MRVEYLERLIEQNRHLINKTVQSDTLDPSEKNELIGILASSNESLIQQIEELNKTKRRFN